LPRRLNHYLFQGRAPTLHVLLRAKVLAPFQSIMAHGDALLFLHFKEMANRNYQRINVI
jgi:hypothetical protein